MASWHENDDALIVATLQVLFGNCQRGYRLAPARQCGKKWSLELAIRGKELNLPRTQGYFTHLLSIAFSQVLGPGRGLSVDVIGHATSGERNTILGWTMAGLCGHAVSSDRPVRAVKRPNSEKLDQ